MSGGRHLWRGRLAIAATVLIWSTPPVFQYWLARSFDPWTQNFYRYAAGFAAMLPFLLWKVGRDRAVMQRIEWKGCAMAAVPNAVHQIAQTMAVVFLLPGIYALAGRISVIMTAVLAVIFFADERWITKSGRFILGTLCGLLGLAGLVWPVGGEVPPGWGTGLALALLAAAGWAHYAILVKKHTAAAGPTIGFGVIGFFTVVLMWPLMLLLGKAAPFSGVDGWTLLVLFGSGVISIGIGHWLYYIGIRELGAAPAQSALLLCPLGTMMISGALLGETFRIEQMVAGAVLLGGAFLALTARPPVIEEPA